MSDLEQFISVTKEEKKWYVIVPKRYGVRYQIEIEPIYRNGNTIKFVTKYIDEELTFTIGKNITLEYRDCNNRIFEGALVKT